MMIALGQSGLATQLIDATSGSRSGAKRGAFQSRRSWLVDASAICKMEL